MRNFSNVATPSRLTAALTAAATSCTVDSVTGHPAVPYTLVIERTVPTRREVVTVTASSGSGPYTLTITRGQDRTAAQAHDANSELTHDMVARDLQEAQDGLAMLAMTPGVL